MHQKEKCYVFVQRPLHIWQMLEQVFFSDHHYEQDPLQSCNCAGGPSSPRDPLCGCIVLISHIFKVEQMCFHLNFAYLPQPVSIRLSPDCCTDCLCI